MSDEQDLAGVVPASEQQGTAPTVSDTQLPDISTEEQQEKPAKTFTQEELDAAIGKRIAREHRKWEREQAARIAEEKAKQAQPKEPLVPDQFNSTEEYADALAVQKAEALIQERERRRQERETLDSYAEREEKAREKYDDFEQVAYNDDVPITDAMAEAIRSSEIGPDVAYYLGMNPKEADRIARLTTIAQAKEIGKIEARLADAPPVKKTTSAPAPIVPVTARASGNSSYDTTDPRSVKQMSTSEWIEAERQRQIKKLEAQRR